MGWRVESGGARCLRAGGGLMVRISRDHSRRAVGRRARRSTGSRTPRSAPADTGDRALSLPPRWFQSVASDASAGLDASTGPRTGRLWEFQTTRKAGRSSLTVVTCFGAASGVGVWMRSRRARRGAGASAARWPWECPRPRGSRTRDGSVRKARRGRTAQG